MLNLAVTLLEPLYATGCVHQLLLAGKKRVAGRTYLRIDLGFCRAGFKGVTAETLYSDIDIFRVDSFSHFQTLL